MTTHGGEAVDFKEINEVAAAALVDAEVDAFCNSRGEFAQFCASPRSLTRNCSRASRNQRVVDGHDLIFCPEPKPFSDVGCCQTDATGA
eukprot:1671885-Pleurochrysis_carterae.AAC.2